MTVRTKTTTVKTFTCDRCGDTETSPLGWTSISAAQLNINDGFVIHAEAQGGGYCHADICESCTESLRGWWEANTVI